MPARLPLFLAPGDEVLLVATARPVTPVLLAPAQASLIRCGLRVRESPYLYAAHGRFAGPDAPRQAALQQALDDPEARAILFARGGYGTGRLLPGLDWSGFAAHPKWLVGFSDLSLLLLEALGQGYASLHAPMALSFAQAVAGTDLEALSQALQGHLPPLLWAPDTANRLGACRGPVVATNLSLLQTTLGTPQQPKLTGAILVLEEVDEYPYRLDRALNHLRRAGLLDHLAGLVLGELGLLQPPTEDGFDSLEALVGHHLQGTHYPVAWGAPVGHGTRNVPLAVGHPYALTVSAQGAQLVPLAT